MEELTWVDIIFTRKGLKELREENNFTVPEEYRKSTYKLALMLAFTCTVMGIFVGLSLGFLYWKGM